MRVFIVLILLISCLSPLAAEENVDTKIKLFLDSYVLGEFLNAAQQLNCPATYSDEKLVKAQEKLANEIAEISKRFGKPIGYQIVRAGVYTELLLGCGPLEDHESMQPIGKLMVDMESESGNDARVNLYVTMSSGQPVLGLVGIGESRVTPGSLERYENLYREMR